MSTYSGRTLTNSGINYAEAAREHAVAELDRWRTERKAHPEPVVAEFEEAIRETRAIDRTRKDEN